MALTKMAWLGPLVVLLSVVAVGCRGGTASRSPGYVELKEIHEMYQRFAKSENKPPRKMADLTSKKFEGGYPGAVQALKQGKYVVVWDVQGEASGTVLAYAKDAPAQGGAVLMADGAVQEMTADALKAALPGK